MARKRLAVCILLLFLSLVFASTAAAVPYTNYTYNFWGRPVVSQQAYLPSAVHDGTSLGVGAFNRPADLAVTPEGKLLVLDGGNHRILVLDHNRSVSTIITGFDHAGTSERFTSPQGIAANEQGIFVADTQNGRVVHLDHDGSLVRIIGAPEPDIEGILPANFRYRPLKVDVDPTGRMYVIAADIYDGLMVFDAGGEFRGFIGAPRVAPSMVDYFWTMIATSEQRARMALILPTEFSNIAVDARGLIYATVSTESIHRDEVIRLLNPSGVDVLRRTGFHPPIGDITTDPTELRSVFVAVAPRDHGSYSVLDRRRGRVFTYDENGNLLYVFGGLGEVVGTFQNPVALAALSNQELAVLDNNRLTVFRPTHYADLIHTCIALYHRGDYEASADRWREVARLNANFDLAYSWIGTALLRQDRYAEAMTYFRLAHDRPGYSDAFARYRREVIGDHFGTVMSFLLLFPIAVYTLGRVRGAQRPRRRGTTVPPVTAQPFGLGYLKQLRRSFAYAFHVIVHPFDGFWDLKHEGRGSLLAASLWLILVTFTYAAVRQYTGFALNPRDLTQLNLILELARVLVPFILWCIVSWGLTTLMNGKGRLSDIFIATAFALVPIVLINLPLTLISRYLTLREAELYYLVLAIGVAWSMALIVLGTMVIHEYDVLKTILTIILVILGMVAVLFIGLLFFSLMDRVVEFIGDLYLEIIIRP